MTNATLEAPAQKEEQTDILTVSDRCDECGSQAYVGVRFVNTGYELMFCAHHYTAYKSKLENSDIKVIDERHKLSDKRLDVSA
jgi:hypothetical protein